MPSDSTTSARIWSARPGAPDADRERFGLVKSRRFRGAAVVGVAALATVISLAVANAGTAAASQSTEPPATGVPTFVHLPADQAAHPGSGTEWWYTVGHISSHGHQYGYEVNLTIAGAQISITDEKTGKFYTSSVPYPADQISASSTELDVRTPAATLSGPMNDMHLTATLPDGSFDLHLNAVGPVMYAGGNGYVPFLGGTSYYYSLPNLQTSGTLTLNGTTSKVTGESWLDRQWGNWDWTQTGHWTWMAIQLDNGESINLADSFSAAGVETQNSATVLHTDGSQSIVTVTPLAPKATDFQTSPTTGQRYAGKWIVEIPSLKTKLTVTATPTLQEIQSGASFSPGINEADSTVTGTYEGKPVTGKAYAEQFGTWK